MFPTSPVSLFDNFPSSPNIFDYNEDIFSFNSYSDEIPSKPDLSDINQICMNQDKKVLILKKIQ